MELFMLRDLAIDLPPNFDGAVIAKARSPNLVALEVGCRIWLP
jgi:hypothetical protein